MADRTFDARLLDASAVMESAPYLFQQDKSLGVHYGLKCASSQSQNCSNNIRESIYGLKCASSQSQNCSNSIDAKVA